MSGLPALLEPIKSGKVLAAGVRSKERDVGAPDVVSAAETPELESLDFYFWTGLLAPKGMLQDALEKVNAAFAGMLREEQVCSRFKDYGVMFSESQTLAQSGQFVTKRRADWATVIKQSGFKKN